MPEPQTMPMPHQVSANSPQGSPRIALPGGICGSSAVSPSIGDSVTAVLAAEPSWLGRRRALCLAFCDRLCSAIPFWIPWAISWVCSCFVPEPGCSAPDAWPRQPFRLRSADSLGGHGGICHRWWMPDCAISASLDCRLMAGAEHLKIE